MKLRNICAAVAITSMALPIAAVAEQGVTYVNGSVGAINFDKETALDTEGYYQLGGEYLFLDNVSAELGYGYSNPNIKGTHRKDVDFQHLFLNGYYYFGDRSGLQPYVSAGVGHADFDATGYNRNEETFVNAGLGARLHVTKRVSLRFDARALHSLDESDIHEQYTVGVSYAFGVKDPAPAPVAAAPVAAPAPVDSDGDGVYDDKDECPNTPAGREVDEKGCEYVLRKTEEVRLQVEFGFDSDVIADQYVPEVERAANFLRRYANVKAEIAGHTDSRGTDAYNQKLSERRANAVRNMLIQRFGIDAGRLTAVGYGESKPVASNDTEAGRAENRRVVAVMQAETTTTK